MSLFIAILAIPVTIFVLGLVLSLFNDISYVVTLMTGIASKLPFMLSFLPSGVGAVVSTTCAIAVIAKILGRDG